MWTGNGTGAKCGVGTRPVLNVEWEWGWCYMWTGNGAGADLMSLEHLPLVEDLESIDLLCPLHLHHLSKVKQDVERRVHC